jgi:outer membrane immunogenic protein
MKKTLGIAIAMMISVPALAADLPVKYKAPVAVPFSWTGFYVGANGGCVWEQNNNVGSPINDSDPGPNSFFTFNTERQGGCFGGLQGGYNYQFSGRWVAGVEVDGQFGQLTSRGDLLEIEGAASETLANYSQTMKYFGTARGRLGYAAELPVFGQTLLFVTGGFAWARNHMNVLALEAAGGTASFSDTKTLTGYTVGGGAEFAFSRNWSVKAEYLFMDFGSNTYNAFVSDDATPLSAVSATTKLHTGRVGLNYRFN